MPKEDDVEAGREDFRLGIEGRVDALVLEDEERDEGGRIVAKVDSLWG